MTMRKRKIIDSTAKERSLGALQEDMNDKFEIIMEATADIPAMQEQLKALPRILSWENDIKLIPKMGRQLNHIASWEDHANMIPQILSWEDDIKLIPNIFDEVGALRTEVEVIKKALELLGRNEPKMEAIEKRLVRVEEKIGAV